MSLRIYERLRLEGWHYRLPALWEADAEMTSTPQPEEALPPFIHEYNLEGPPSEMIKELCKRYNEYPKQTELIGELREHLQLLHEHEGHRGMKCKPRICETAKLLRRSKGAV